jgi:glycosyltransferase involved in cell wall biosynthesis
MAGIRIVRFNCAGNYVSGLFGDVNAYKRFIKEQPADLLVLHCAQTWTIDALLDDFEHLGKRVVLVSHGLSCYRNPAYESYFSLLASKLKISGHVTGLSERLEEVALCRDHGLQAPVIIPNGVDLAEWNVAPIGMRKQWGIGSRPWAVSISNHSTVKNHGAFWRVVKAVKNALPELQGSIIGRPYRAERLRVGRLGVKGGCWYKCRLRRLFSNRVFLHKSAKREEVVSALQEADLLLVTSFREASPLVLLESMAAGVPWVSFRVGGVEDNVGGMVVDSETEMIDASIKLLNDHSVALELGRCGRERVASKHDWEKIIDSHLAFYARCIADRRI